MKNKVLLLLIILCTSCNNYSTMSEMKKMVLNNSSILENTCNKFLADSSIRSISIYKCYDSVLCESINSWSRCDKGWETWNKEREEQVTLPTKAAVLKFEHIAPEDYNYFKRFLKERNLTSIGRVYNCKNCVDLESSLAGVRYSINPQYVLREDYEYLTVDRVNPHWFVYYRDWN